MNRNGMLAAAAHGFGQLSLVFVLGLVCSGTGYAQGDDDVPARAGPATNAEGDEETFWEKLDWNPDGALDGKELEGGWIKFDTDANGEVTKAEFMAGRAKERKLLVTQSPEADMERFNEVDISKNGLLTGIEIDAGNARSYDVNGDGRVTKKEFLEGCAKWRKSAGKGTNATPTTDTLLAQEDQYKPGDKIWYKKSRFPLVWEEGTFLRASPDGKRALYRQKPNQFFKDGFETGALWEHIRPIHKSPLTQDEDVEEDTTGVEANRGEGLLTQAEILDILQARLGSNPAFTPQAVQIKTEVGRLIKRRGLDFLDQVNSKFWKQRSKYGVRADYFRYNSGSPTTLAWLTGSWNLTKTGTAVDFEKPDGIYRDTEMGVGGLGTLTLKSNSTYVWKHDIGTVGGKWRKTTSEEMGYQGGDGVVLLRGKGDVDWIVMQDRRPTMKGDWVFLAQLKARSIKEKGRKR